MTYYTSSESSGFYQATMGLYPLLYYLAEEAPKEKAKPIDFRDLLELRNKKRQKHS